MYQPTRITASLEGPKGARFMEFLLKQAFVLSQVGLREENSLLIDFDSDALIDRLRQPLCE